MSTDWGDLASLSPLGLMMSSRRQIVLCNTAFAHIFGHEIHEMQGASLAMLYPSQDEFERIGQRGWQVMATQGQYQDERLMRRRDGSLIWVRVHGRAADLTDAFETASWVFEPLSAVADAERLTPREREVLAGMAKGHSNVELTDEAGGTRLRYTAQAAIGGKLGQVGGRMIDAASKQMADQFFTAFNAQLVPAESAPASEPAAPVDAPAANPSATPASAAPVRIHTPPASAAPAAKAETAPAK